MGLLTNNRIERPAKVLNNINDSIYENGESTQYLDIREKSADNTNDVTTTASGSNTATTPLLNTQTFGVARINLIEINWIIPTGSNWTVQLRRGETVLFSQSGTGASSSSSNYTYLNDKIIKNNNINVRISTNNNSIVVQSFLRIVREDL